MPQVFIPPQLRKLTGGADIVTLAGTTVGQLLDALEAEYPGTAARLRDGEKLASGLAVTVDGAVSSQGLRTKVQEESEVHFLPAIGGG